MGFLHASPVHVATFDELLRLRLPEASTSHVVDEALLVIARAQGPEAVSDEVRRGLDELKASGAAPICTTYSTIGDVAESADSDVPVFRVDRPMAR